MKKGFTLIEMLVVIGLIVLLMGASIGGYSYAVRRAQKARGRELVSNVATALNVLYQRQNRWPPAMLSAAQSDGLLTEKAAYALAKYVKKKNDADNLPVENRPLGGMGLTYDIKAMELRGLDRCGIVSPWAMEVIKRQPAASSALDVPVPGGGKVRDHRLHFAVDDDGDGIVDVKFESSTAVKVRAAAVVWSWGMNGVEDDYEKSMSGRGAADDIYSWTRGQEVR